MIKAIEKEQDDEVDEIRARQEENKIIQIQKRNNGFVIKLKRKDLRELYNLKITCNFF